MANQTPVKAIWSRMIADKPFRDRWIELSAETASIRNCAADPATSVEPPISSKLEKKNGIHRLMRAGHNLELLPPGGCSAAGRRWRSLFRSANGNPASRRPR